MLWRSEEQTHPCSSLEVCSTAVARYAQPALFVAGLAAVEALRKDSAATVDGCSVTAGLSLGEYTALVFAGALSFEDGLKVGQLCADIFCSDRSVCCHASALASPDRCPSGGLARRTCSMCSAGREGAGGVHGGCGEAGPTARHAVSHRPVRR